MALTVLPNVLAGLRVLLHDQTSAGPRVDRTLPASVKDGAITIRRDGGVGLSRDLRVDTARVVIESWHASEEKAHKLAREAEAVMLSDYVNGFHGLVNGVKFEGVFRDAGISYVPDPETGEHRYRASYLVNYTNPY